MKHFILLIVCNLVLAIPMSAQTFYRTGSLDPVETDHLPGVVLAGGATDNDDAMKWMLERADGGDVVVLRASGSDGYNNYFYTQLGVAVNSVTTIVIRNASQANNPEVIDAVNNAEVVFIAGGDQWNYVNYWRNSTLLQALNALINDKQITIGGTSAGMAVLGEVVFTAENATVWSSEALNNPYHWRVMLEKGFLDVPYMHNIVTDTHYNRLEGDNRDRKGRHVTFMARMATDWSMPAKGIAANEYTAIAIDENGIARVFGHPGFDDYGYFLTKYAGPPEVCREETPLTWYQDKKALKVYKIKGDFDGNGWFDVDNWSDGEGGVWQYWYAENGYLYQTDADDNDETSLPQQFTVQQAVNIYPNPVGSVLNFSVNYELLPATDQMPFIRILAICGKVLHTQPLEKNHAGIFLKKLFSVNVDSYRPGIYLLELNAGQHTGSLLWIKQ